MGKTLKGIERYKYSVIKSISHRDVMYSLVNTLLKPWDLGVMISGKSVYNLSESSTYMDSPAMDGK